MIFQDPMTSLNPFLRIEDQLIEPLLLHGVTDKTGQQALEMLEKVGIPVRRIRMYPHEFSGGMRQEGHDCHGPDHRSRLTDCR